MRTSSAGDVRLTNGRRADVRLYRRQERPEWNTLAQGPNKYKLGDQLCVGCAIASPSGFLHHGQGKWYPGEALPPGRSDSIGAGRPPDRRDPTLIGDETQNHNPQHEEEREEVITQLSLRLGANPDHAIRGSKTSGTTSGKNAPAGMSDPFDSKLENKQDRDRLARFSSRGLKR